MCIHLECFHFRDGWVTAGVWTIALAAGYRGSQVVYTRLQIHIFPINIIHSDKPDNEVSWYGEMYSNGM